MSATPSIYCMRDGCAAIAVTNHLGCPAHLRCVCCGVPLGRPSQWQLMPTIDGEARYACVGCRASVTNVYLNRGPTRKPAHIAPLGRIRRLYPGQENAAFAFNLIFSSAAVHVLGNVAAWQRASSLPIPMALLLAPRDKVIEATGQAEAPTYCSDARRAESALPCMTTCRRHSPCNICGHTSPIDAPRAMLRFGLDCDLPVCFGCASSVTKLAPLGECSAAGIIRPIVARARAAYSHVCHDASKKSRKLIGFRTRRMFYAAVAHKYADTVRFGGQ